MGGMEGKCSLYVAYKDLLQILIYGRILGFSSREDI